MKKGEIIVIYFGVATLIVLLVISLFPRHFTCQLFFKTFEYDFNLLKVATVVFLALSPVHINLFCLSKTKELPGK